MIRSDERHCACCRASGKYCISDVVSPGCLTNLIIFVLVFCEDPYVHIRD